MSSSIPLSPSQNTRPSFFRSISASSTNTITSNILPQKDKPRLYLAIYPKGGSHLTSSYSSSVTCDSYHWTLLIGPQSASRDEPGTLFQIVHDGPTSASSTPYSNSFYEETTLSQQSRAQSQALLARITLAKVVDEKRLRSLLRSLPPSTPSTLSHSNHSDSGYDTDDVHVTSNCLTWVKAAYKILTTDNKCLRGYLGPDDWPEVEQIVRLYARKKRRQGRYSQGVPEEFRTWKDDEIPTWNFWENRETTE